MNLSELKLAAIKEVIKLNKEENEKEILLHLQKLSNEKKEGFETEAFFENVSEKYDDILKKLSK